MGYRGSDRSSDRWRDRDEGRRDHIRSDYDRDDRGFLDRAGDEVRSWFGDDEAERRRELDERRWAREREMSGQGRDHGDTAGGGWGNQRGDSWHRDRPGERSFGGGEGEYRGDPHYSEWRSRQIDEFDRDYDDYRREHQSKFEQEFGSWRSKRQGQRQLLGRVTEHMEVTGSDGEAVGTVDKVRGDRIILTKSGEESGGLHHSIPCSWVETVEDKVILNKSAADAKQEWRSEEENRAFFDRDERGGEGPHMLNRSFAGTYGRRE